MSIILPGNPRQLRFSGEVKAFSAKDDPLAAGVALGKPRVRRNTAPPTPMPPPPEPEPLELSDLEPDPETNLRTHLPPFAPLPPMRGPQADYTGDDDQATMALDREREHLDAPVPIPRRSSRASAAPVPHFRPATPMAATLPPGGGVTVDHQRRGAPLALWLCAAVLAGVLSYFVTPMAMSHFETPPTKVVAADAR